MPLATVAPAAPSTSAPTAQPTPGPALDATATSASTPATPAAPDTQQRLAKPLKPIPSLPGVFPDDDPFPSPPSRSDGPSDSQTASGNAPVRGPDGRFVAGSSPATTDTGEHTPQPGPQTPQPPTSKFKFAGEEFTTQVEAEQKYRSMLGRFGPLQSLARSLGGVDKIIPQFGEAAASARAWKAEADRLRVELDARGAQPAADAASTAQAAPGDTADSVDWELYAEVKRLATDSGEPWKAEQWLIEQVRKADEAKYTRLLDERLAPFTAKDEQQAVADQTETLFGSLSEYTNSDGSVAFPELHDETAAYEVGKLWASLGFPAESALTPQGAVAAIAIYRMAKQGRSQAGPGSTAAPPATPFSPPAPTDAHAAAGVSDGRSSALSVGSDGTPSAEAARILQGLRSANSGNRALLGFDA